MVQAAIGFGFASHWFKTWRQTFKPIPTSSNRNHVISFDSQLKRKLLQKSPDSHDFSLHLLACEQALSRAVRVGGEREREIRLVFRLGLRVRLESLLTRYASTVLSHKFRFNLLAVNHFNVLDVRLVALSRL